MTLVWRVSAEMRSVFGRGRPSGIAVRPGHPSQMARARARAFRSPDVGDEIVVLGMTLTSVRRRHVGAVARRG